MPNAINQKIYGDDPKVLSATLISPQGFKRRDPVGSLRPTVLPANLDYLSKEASLPRVLPGLDGQEQ